MVFLETGIYADSVTNAESVSITSKSSDLNCPKSHITLSTILSLTLSLIVVIFQR